MKMFEGTVDPSNPFSGQSLKNWWPSWWCGGASYKNIWGMKINSWRWRLFGTWSDTLLWQKWDWCIPKSRTKAHVIHFYHINWECWYQSESFSCFCDMYLIWKCNLALTKPNRDLVWWTRVVLVIIIMHVCNNLWDLWVDQGKHEPIKEWICIGHYVFYRRCFFPVAFMTGDSQSNQDFWEILGLC